MSGMLIAAYFYVALTVAVLPRHGWGRGKVSATIVLMATGESVLLLGNDPAVLMFGVMALAAALLALAEMLIIGGRSVNVAWIICGFLILLLNWRQTHIAQWLTAWRPWVVVLGLVAAFVLATLARRSARVARDPYEDLRGI